MTDNLEAFPPKVEDLVLACSCGGTTFFIRSDHMLICAACDEEMEDDVTGLAIAWDRIKKVDQEPRTVREYATVDLAFRGVLSMARQGETAALIVMNMNGKTSVWSDGWDGSPEHEEWFQTRVDGLMEPLR